jgi:hypothetical protein
MPGSLTAPPPDTLPAAAAPAGKYVISPETSLFTVASAALYGIILAAQNEYAEAPFRVNEIRLYAMFKRQSGGLEAQMASMFGSAARRTAATG